jgi:hypothetical protein
VAAHPSGRASRPVDHQGRGETVPTAVRGKAPGAAPGDGAHAGRDRHPYAPTLLRLLSLRGLRRLVGVRVLSSFGDGAFQGALVSAVLFNPERQSSAAAIAGGFAVLPGPR